MLFYFTIENDVERLRCNCFVRRGEANDMEKNAVVDADIERQIVLYCSIETFYLEFNREKPAVYDDRLKHKHRQMPIIQRIF